MPIFQIRPEGLTPVAVANFQAEGLRERSDIQRLLKQRIACLEDGLLVLADEFTGWLDSARRIDLLCLDTDANLVVIEIKRDQEGGHMELQALRYAAMVSSMTFDQSVETLARQRSKTAPDTDTARADILAFLGWAEPHEDGFATETRIILVAADFGMEVTTSVLWLRDRDIDIRCIRLKPYRMEDGRLLLDIQQLIPLPEAADFQTRLGVKRVAERKDRVERHDLRYRFWETLLSCAKTRTTLHGNRSPTKGGWVGAGIGRAGFGLNYVARQQDTQVELFISNDKQAYSLLLGQREAIEADFGGALDWQELPDAQGSRICFVIDGGYRFPAEAWAGIQDTMIDAMIRLDRALRKRVQAVRP